MDGVRQGLMLMGAVLIAISLAMLLYLSSTIYTIFTDPAQVKFVQFLQEKALTTDGAFSGEAEGKKFDIHISESMRYIIFFYFGLLGLGIVSRIFSGIMGTGIMLVKASKEIPGIKAAASSSDMPPPPSM
ncbi:MAG: hypothetical protein ACAH83_16620 [Alphaproteobacteria bacterium]